MLTKNIGKLVMSKAEDKKPSDIKIGDTIAGYKITSIKGLVKGKPTYASTFTVSVEMRNWIGIYGKARNETKMRNNQS